MAADVIEFRRPPGEPERARAVTDEPPIVLVLPVVRVERNDGRDGVGRQPRRPK